MKQYTYTSGWEDCLIDESGNNYKGKFPVKASVDGINLDYFICRTQEDIREHGGSYKLTTLQMYDIDTFEQVFIKGVNPKIWLEE